jgi:hypothetical protein
LTRIEIFTPGGSIEFKNMSFFILHYSSQKSRTLKWARHAVLMGKVINMCEVVEGEPVLRQPLGRTRKWEDNIKMDFRKIECKDERQNWLWLCPVSGFGVSELTS